MEKSNIIINYVEYLSIIYLISRSTPAYSAFARCVYKIANLFANETTMSFEYYFFWINTRWAHFKKARKSVIVYAFGYKSKCCVTVYKASMKSFSSTLNEVPAPISIIWNEHNNAATTF